MPGHDESQGGHPTSLSTMNWLLCEPPTRNPAESTEADSRLEAGRHHVPALLSALLLIQVKISRGGKTNAAL
jgi:hypothetical protein